VSEQPEQKPARRRRRGIGSWILNGILLMAGLVFILGLSLAGRSINAPKWVADKVVARVNSSLGAGRITLGRLQVQIDRDGVPRVFLDDLGIFDAGGTEVVRLNNVGVQLSVSSLFDGSIKPETVSLNGAQMTLRRRADGRFDISVGTGSATTGTLADMLDKLDQAFLGEVMNGVSLLNAEDLTITLEDARTGRLWQITEGTTQLRRADTGLDISVAFDVFNGTEELAETIIGISTKFADSSATIGTTFKNAASDDIALQSPALSFLTILDAPISGAIRANLDPDGAVSSLSGTLEIARGELQASSEVQGFGFSSAKAYFDFDPIRQKIEFSELSFRSDAASVVASGQAYLRDLKDGWPSTLLGQFALSDLRAHPEDVFEEEVVFSGGAADFRLRLNPFSVEIGQLVLQQGDEKLVANGTISTLDAGWKISADLTVNQISNARLMSLWPVNFSPNTRRWLTDNMTSATLTDIRAALRAEPGKPLRRSIGWQFRDTAVRYIKSQSEIQAATGYASIDGSVFTLVIEDGLIKPPEGGSIRLGDSTIKIPDLTLKPAPIAIRLKGAASTTAVLSLLNEPPFRIFRNASFGADVSAGQTEFDAEIDFTLKREILLEDVAYSATAVLSNVSSEKLIPGRKLTAQNLNLTANNDAVEIAGPLRLGEVAADMIWRQETAAAGRSAVDGTVELSQAFISEFGIGLPKGAVSGTGLGQFHIDFVRDQPPEFTLQSDLNRLGLRISQIGWNKRKNTTGALDVAGTLGAQSKIDLLEIRGGGLEATGGQVTLAEDGSMQAATFARVRVGGWLDAPVTLRGRGAGRVPSVHINGGTIDIRKTAFGGAASSSGGPGGPISLNMDKVIVSQGIALTNFVGEFSSAGGFNGNFTARMNSKTPLTGRLAPDANGTAIRIQSDNAGALLRNAGVVEYAENGGLTLTLRPRAANGVYDGQLQIRRTNVRNAPGMTDLLSAISIVGLLEQMSGAGILFENVQATFLLSPTSVQLIRSSAVGPSLGVSLDGIYDLTTSTMNMQGVVSPVYFLNAIGQIFSRRGEGLFGFNFKLKGTADAPKVSVNPLSILTPGIFRDIFRAPPPTPRQ